MYLITYVTRMKNLENVKCVHIIKCAKERAFFAENKVPFARAERRNNYMVLYPHLLHNIIIVVAVPMTDSFTILFISCADGHY